MGPESTLVAGSGALGALPEHEPVGIFSDVNRLSSKYILLEISTTKISLQEIFSIPVFCLLKKIST